jgi:tetratricopeptide (TPR) repeat protein
LCHLGDLKRKQGLFPDAITLYQSALDVLEVCLGKDHDEVAETLTSMGICKGMKGQKDAASKCFKRAQGIIEKTFGNQHPKYVALTNYLLQYCK